VFSFGPIDNLRYTYNTTQKNRLESITESASTAYGFKVKSGVVTSTAKYEYDKNGNLIKDPYKKITEIRYNHLNLPEYIRFDESATSRNEISIRYDAKGQKWAKSTRVMKLSNTTPAYWNIFSENTYYYDSGIEYRTGNSTAPDILQTEEGRMVWIPASGTTTGYYGYEYAIRDHLGNTRVMVSDRNRDNKIDMKTEIMQVNHYYPFGMNQDGPWLAGNSGDHKYQYNGKELNSEFGLEWLAYGARYYDAAVGRFPSVDPVIEKFAYLTPYNYASNEPVGMIDLHGLQGVRYDMSEIGKKGKIIEKTIIEMNLYVGVNTADSKSYQNADIDRIKDNLNREYNKGYKIGGKIIEFKFNVQPFDLGVKSAADFASELRKSSIVDTKTPNGIMSEKGPLMKKSIMSAVISINSGVKPSEGNTHLNNIMISPDASNMNHTEAHEVGHFLLLGSGENPSSVSNHNSAGGIFKYKTVDPSGEVVENIEQVNKSNIKIILENVPEKKD
jgi:RHS repeat-associated protein